MRPARKEFEDKAMNAHIVSKQGTFNSDCVLQRYNGSLITEHRTRFKDIVYLHQDESNHVFMTSARFIFVFFPQPLQLMISFNALVIYSQVRGPPLFR